MPSRAASALVAVLLVGACGDNGSSDAPGGGSGRGGGSATGGKVSNPAGGSDGVAGAGARAGGLGSGGQGAGGVTNTGGRSGMSGGSSGGGAGGATSAGRSSGGTSGGSATGGGASGGSANAGGTSAGSANGGGTSAGSANGGGATGGAPFMCSDAKASTATRPQLTSAQASAYTTLEYLAHAGTTASRTTDDWDPTAGLGDAAAFTADYTVAADGSGSHTKLKDAIDDARGSERVYILLEPGTYRETISIPNSAPPITLYGRDADASKVVIVDNRSAGDAGGTGNSASVTVRSPGFQALNLTISNDFATPSSGSNLQAVALYTTGDKVVLENVRLHGFQDTLYVDSSSPTTLARVYIKNSFIEGDTDFIFGRATLVIDGSTIHYLSSRKGSGAGVHLAPSTHVDNPRGFLVIGSTFTADASAPMNKISLGRSWDQSSTTPTPNGQAVIRESVLGAHINKQAPWTSAATTGRAFSADGNRFDEYCNSGAGS